jgi:thymidylate synthase
VKLGTYKHMVGSLHIYDSDRDKVQRFLNEGFQSRISMPPMPVGNPWSNVTKLTKVEALIRQDSKFRLIATTYQATGQTLCDFCRYFP